MARGFESKDVEFQQAESERRKAPGRALTAEERASLEQRRTVELSLVRARAQLASARTAAHRQMLTAAVASLEEQLGRFPGGRPDA
jgi:hypothetical protein